MINSQAAPLPANHSDNGFEQAETGFIFDYRHVPPMAVKELTKNQLAKLELELHALRVAWAGHGKNGKALVGPNRTIEEEIARVEQLIANIEGYFKNILAYTEVE